MLSTDGVGEMLRFKLFSGLGEGGLDEGALIGRGGAGTGGRFMALGRGLIMLGLGIIPESVLSDCFGKTCEELFGDVEVVEDPEPCLCIAGVPVPHCCWCCWAELEGMGVGETTFVCESKRESLETLDLMVMSGSNSARWYPLPTLSSCFCCSESNLMRSGCDSLPLEWSEQVILSFPESY